MRELMFDLKRIAGLLGIRAGSTRTYLVVLLLMLTGIFSIALPDQFFRIANLQSMASQIPELGILAMAMMITMLSGGINLAIIASANMAGIVTAYILTHFIAIGTPATTAALVMMGAVIAGLAVSMMIGLLNGWIIAYLSVSPILATLGTMTLIQGLNVLLTKGYVISGFPEPIVFIGNGLVLGIPLPILIFVACALFMSLLLRKTAFGESVYMMGSNEKATQFSGIRVKRFDHDFPIQLGQSGLRILIPFGYHPGRSAGRSRPFWRIWQNDGSGAGTSNTSGHLERS